MNDARATAAIIVAEVIRTGRSLSAAAEPHLRKLADPRDRAFAQELAYGVLRFLPQLEPLTQALLEQSLRPRDTDVLALIAAGLYQMIHLQTPSYAAVSATVAAGQALGKPWARGLVNAVLRNYLRGSERLLARINTQEPARYAHPEWFLDALKRAWPAHWQAIVEANNRRPPMTLRVNARRMARDDYLQLLNQAGIAAEAAPQAPHGIVLSQPMEVKLLPGFDEGWVSVQDAAAQLAAPLLDLSPGQRVLDACAAPGGKTAHILEIAPAGVTLTAVEKDLDRLTLLRTTLERLRLEAEIISGDASRPEEWWDGRQFDRILLDAPCSGSGVIRRHPDIKFLRRPEDIPRLAEEQGRLLAALWPLLAPRGTLLYATCSVLIDENQRLITAFMDQESNARLVNIEAPWGLETGAGRQILPGESGMDGFFYARLVKADHA